MSNTIICTNCGREIDSNDTFCKFCGYKNTITAEDTTTNLDEEYQCPSCGRKLLSSDKYCIYCGASLFTSVISAEDEYKCPHCGETVLSSDKFCIHCGFGLLYGSSVVASVEEPVRESFVKRKTVITAAVCLILVLGILGYFMALRPYLEYKKAEGYMVNADYANAISVYEKLNNYRDSSDRLLEAKYSYAVTLLESGDYQNAIDEFESIADYKNSKEEIKECRYQYAGYLKDSQKYQEAIKEYDSIEGYKDAKNRSDDIKYILAMDLFEKEQFDEAKLVFDSISNYKNSVAMSKECMYQTALLFISQKDYNKSNDILIALEDYKDSKQLIHTHDYKETIITPVTCFSDGYATYKCEVCGDYYEETIKSTGHIWVNATCTSPKTCSRCGETVGEALGHTTTTGVCSRCGRNFTSPKTFKGSFSAGYSEENSLLFFGNDKYNCNLPKGSYRISISLSSSDKARLIVYLSDGTGSMSYEPPYNMGDTKLVSPGNKSVNCTLNTDAKEIIIHYAGEGSYTVTVTPID